jgi:hypothetical protein
MSSPFVLMFNGPRSRSQKGVAGFRGSVATVRRYFSIRFLFASMNGFIHAMYTAVR